MAIHVEVFAAGSTLAEPRLAEYGDVDTSVVSLPIWRARAHVGRLRLHD